MHAASTVYNFTNTLKIIIMRFCYQELSAMLNVTTSDMTLVISVIVHI